jgi:hypothetical protein
MKNTVKNTLITIAIIIAPLAAFAAKESTPKSEYQLPEYKVEDLTLPVPVKVVVPRIGGRLLGHEVRMKFEISAEGRAYNIGQQGISPDQRTNDLVAAMKMVLLSWEFEPALNNSGNAVAVKVIMPVQVVKKGNKTTALASLILDDSSNRM